MNKYIRRMTACGIPLQTARKVYRDFKARRRLSALGEYIDRVEVICRE